MIVRNKKFLIAIALIVLITPILLWFITGSEQEEQMTDEEALFDQTETQELRFTEIPETDTVNIDSVEVNNFVRQNYVPDRPEIIDVANDTDYNIMYMNRFDEFLISVKSAPFFQKRIIAENEFLEELGISKEEACEMDVKVTTPRFANPDEAGVEYPLSFCQ